VYDIIEEISNLDNYQSNIEKNIAKFNWSLDKDEKYQIRRGKIRGLKQALRDKLP
jgi:hypothetical protein